MMQLLCCSLGPNSDVGHVLVKTPSTRIACWGGDPKCPPIWIKCQGHPSGSTAYVQHVFRASTPARKARFPCSHTVCTATVGMLVEMHALKHNNIRAKSRVLGVAGCPLDFFLLKTKKPFLCHPLDFGAAVWRC